MIATSHLDVGRLTNLVRNPRRFKKYSSDAGFTLIELLVVLGIIAILAAMILPALAGIKSRGQAVRCVNNKRQLTLAWIMYSNDNDSRLANNYGGPGGAPFRGIGPTATGNWMYNNMDWSINPDNTNLNFVAKSSLGFYASYTVDIFHCPADYAVSALQKQAGWTHRARSIAMNAMVGNPGPDVYLWGMNTNNPGYQQFLKESDIPDPASIFVFLDEHPDSITDGYFLNTDNGQWRNLPGSYHNGGCTFSFADGHVEIHRWLSPSTVRPPLPASLNLPITVRSGDQTDLQWVLQHTSVDRAGVALSSGGN